MKKLLVTLALVLGLATVATVAATGTALAGTTTHYGSVVTVEGQDCLGTFQPPCTVFIRRGDQVSYTPIAQANNWQFTYPWCGRSYPDWQYSCEPMPGLAWLFRQPMTDQTTGNSWYAYARRPCPVGGGYQWSELRHSAVLPSGANANWEAFLLQAGCQPTAPW